MKSDGFRNGRPSLLAPGLSLLDGLPVVGNRIRLWNTQGPPDGIDVECGELPTARRNQCRHVDTAFAANKEVRRSRSEPITPQLRGVGDLECDRAVRIRGGARAMPAAKAALTSPHNPLLRLFRCAQDETKRTAMASAFKGVQRGCHHLAEV